MLEKVFMHGETNMIESTLKIRGKKFFPFRASLCIVRSNFFTFVMVCCIVGNAIVLGLDFYPIDT